MTSQNRESAATTATQRLASLILGQDVLDFIAARRPPAGNTAWRFIARELYDATDGQIDVTYETLRTWHGEAAA